MPLVVRVVRQSSLEHCVESSVGPGVLRWVVSCDETVQQVLERLVGVLFPDRVEELLLRGEPLLAA